MGLQKAATASSLGCVEMLLVAIICPTARVYLFEALPADGKKVVGTPTPSDKFNAAPAASFNPVSPINRKNLPK
jgi:hypothetical protein